MEKCIWCEGVYEAEESTASERVKTAVCSKECEENYDDFLDQPLVFI